MTAEVAFIMFVTALAVFGMGIVVGVFITAPLKEDPRQLKIGQIRKITTVGEEWYGKVFTITGYGEYDGFDGEITFNDGISTDVMWKWIYENSEVVGERKV